MNKKRIVVTQGDIDHGIRGSFCDCPVARATRRAFRSKSDRRVVVRHEGIFVGDLEDDAMWTATLPPEVDRFISRFDDGKKVAPFKAVVAFR